MLLDENLTIDQKLGILADAAKYDVACTSSGVQRDGKSGEIGNSIAGGICHTFSADGRCISLLKVLFTNECIYDCKYCINRSSNDVPRTSFTPRELCELTMGFYKRNYIEGLFLSSGILHTPNYTMELICQTLVMLREEYHFRGYIHCKAIPGADPSLIEYAGWYADRMSVNLELPTSEGLRQLAPHKNRKNILQPMRQIQAGIDESRDLLGCRGGNRSAYWFTRQAAEKAGLSERFHNLSLSDTDEKKSEPLKLEQADISKTSGGILLPDGQGNENNHSFEETKKNAYASQIRNGDLSENDFIVAPGNRDTEQKGESAFVAPVKRGAESFRPKLSMLKSVGVGTGRGFAAAGQSTQMIIGATPETDYQLVSVTEALYKQFDLKRVFFSAFVKVNEDKMLPDLPGGPPLLREHRLYQADWLMRYYGFRSGELLTEKRPNFNPVLDPKCDWAVHHMECFPVEIRKADYFLLLRVPGIGPKSARRIIDARKGTSLTFENLKKIGVVLKRAQYFITCGGRMLGKPYLDEEYVTRSLVAGERLPKNLQDALFGHQMSFFELPGFQSAGAGG